MTDQAILVVCQEPDLARSLCQNLEKTCGIGVSLFASVSEVMTFRALDGFALALVCLNGHGDLKQLGDLLLKCSRAGRALPVIIVSDVYDEAEGLTCFQMGVTDYLSWQDHREALADLVGRLILPQSGGAEAGGKPRSVRAFSPMPTHAVSCISIS